MVVGFVALLVLLSLTSWQNDRTRLKGVSLQLERTLEELEKERRRAAHFQTELEDADLALQDAERELEGLRHALTAPFRQ